MAKKLQEEVPKGAPLWMTSYSDMMSLLVCFFVLLYAMADINPQKLQAFTAAMNNLNVLTMDSGSNETLLELIGNGILEMPDISYFEGLSDIQREKAREELEQFKDQLNKQFAENNLNEKIQISSTEDSILLNFKDSVLFDVGKANLRNEAIMILDLVADELINFPFNDIYVFGHTDNDPINTPQYPSNWHLSSYRAINVGLYFIENANISPSRISAVGRGEYDPIVPNDSINNKAKNRRVEIVINSRYVSGGGV